MKTFQMKYSGQEEFQGRIDALKGELGTLASNRMLFHVFAECWCDDDMRAISRISKEAFPNSQLVGTASFGNIVEGQVSREDITIGIMVFEDPSTKVEVVRCPLVPGEAIESLNAFVDEVAAKPWVKAVEAFVMAKVEEVTICCNELAKLPEHIELFGGKSRFDHSPVAPKFVIDDEGNCLADAAAFVLYGGENLHVKSGLIRGWNPLGRTMKVTKSHSDILCELDGQPAYDLYYKYLHIKNDENYFFNTLEFPLLFYKDGKSVIRISHACLDDGSMVLGASIPENDYVRIAFGDANEIMRSVLEGGREFEPFRPEAFILYSCACRRTYWGDERSNHETMPFQKLAPTFGFYTAGELLKRDGEVTEHNSTLIVAALREGDVEAGQGGAAAGDAAGEARFGLDESVISSAESTNSRLSTFIAAAIDELEAANRKLTHLSRTDGLTGLLNRREIERLICEALGSEPGAHGADEPVPTGPMHLIMMDLDDFKATNDRYGHHEGDLVLQEFSALLAEQAESFAGDALVGRWGGEEFIVLTTGADEAAVSAFAEGIRARFAERAFELSGSHSVSIGMTATHAGEDPDTATNRADAAMYEAKHRGKNCVVKL